MKTKHIFTAILFSTLLSTAHGATETMQRPTQMGVSQIKHTPEPLSINFKKAGVKF